MKLLKEKYKTYDGARKRAAFENGIAASEFKNGIAASEFKNGYKAKLYRCTIVTVDGVWRVRREAVS
jgi:hypothetical protein